MKNNTLLIIVLLVAIAIAVWYFGFKRKKLPKVEPLKGPDDEQKETPTQKAQPDPNVMELQTYLNSQLPADYEKLKVDGILGPKTRAAMEYVKTHHISQGDTKTASGLQQLIDVVTPINDIKQGIDFVDNRLKSKWNSFKKFLGI